MDRNGIETMLMNYYRKIDRSNMQFDFIVNKSKPGDYDEEILNMGGRIFKSPGLSPTKYPQYMHFVENILKADSGIKVMHAHNEAMGLYALRGAERYGLSTRIAHAHNTEIIKDYKYPLKIVCKAFLPSAATDYWACGNASGIYYFGEELWNKYGKVIHNAIELEKFRYQENIRIKVRRKYGLENCFVIGHVGRFNIQKNHIRLLEIFAQVAKHETKARLVLIGVGELTLACKEKAKSLGIDDKVFFLGLRTDVNEWYQAFDLFLMPSLFEGLPVVGIEAQASGLPCVFSDNVTDEVLILPLSCRLSLKKSNEEWAQIILKISMMKRIRANGVEMVSKSGYNIDIESQKLQATYIEMSERNQKI
jgi:glycosyltransferase involved in cell wall biosynthesis